MAKSPLMPYSDITDNLLFWLKKYLKFKVMTLNNKKASPQIVKKELLNIEKAKTFDEVLKIARRLKKQQIPVYTYFYPVYSFLKWLSEGIIDDLKDIDLELVLEWITQATSSKSDMTKVNYKNALINFFEFLSKNNRDKYNFDIDLKSWQKNIINANSKRPSFMTRDELDRFLNVLENYNFIRGGSRKKAKPDEYLNAMYKLVIKIALFGGLRINEIASLSPDDLYINKKKDWLEIYIQEGKNNNYRIVTLPYSKGKYTIKNNLQNFLNLRKHIINEICPHLKKQLFVTYKCSRLSSKVMRARLKEILKQAGIVTEKKGLHILRHTHATYFFENTGDIALTKERLGHKDVRTTMKYVHISEEKMKKSADVLR